MRAIFAWGLTLLVMRAPLATAQTAEGQSRGNVQQNGGVQRSIPATVLRKVGAKEHVPSVTMAISPDGKLAAFITANGDLGIRDLAGGKSRVLVKRDTSSGHPFDPVFSPDGKSLVYEALVEGSFSDMYLINLDGSNRHRLFRRHELVRYAFPYDWSHNGKYIAALFERRDGTYQIVLVNAAVGSSLVLKTLDWWSPTRMAFSANDRFLAYDAPQSDDGGARDIYLLATNGSREDTVVSHAADDFLLGWSQDGNYIVFGSDRGKGTGVWIQAVTDGHAEGSPKLINSDVGNISSLGITRSGSLYYNVFDQPANAYIATFDRSTGKVIGLPARVSKNFVGGNAAPDWSPDGKQIAYLRQPFKAWNRASVSIDSRVIMVQSLESGEERSLPFHLRTHNSDNLRWSPDGHSLLVGDRDRKGRSGLIVIDAETGEVRSAFVSLAFWCEWARDGRSIYYEVNDTSTHPGTEALCVRNLQTSEERVLYRGAVGPGFAVSPDGKQIAFSEFKMESKLERHPSVFLKIIPSTGGDARTILVMKSPETIGAISWSVDGTSLFFVWNSRGAGESELWQISDKGGELKRIGLPIDPKGQIGIHPDGRRIAYQAGENTSQVWVMENFLPRSKGIHSTEVKRK